MTVAVVAVALLVVLIGGLLMIRRGRRTATGVAAGDAGPAMRADQPARSSKSEVEVVAAAPLPESAIATAALPEPAIVPSPLTAETQTVPPDVATELHWYRQFDPQSTGLDDTTRLRLIGDLGVVADEWCVPLLSDAYCEEQRPVNRQAALIALTACRSSAAVATYRLALASDNLAERAIAEDALADLEPAHATRTTIERR